MFTNLINWFKKMSWKKRILLVVSLVLIVLCTSHCKLIIYGVRQGYGQVRMVMKSRKIDEVLADKNFPDSLKQKLRLVIEIKKYAIDSLGLNPSKNYNTVYDQKGQPIVWIVSACPKYSLDAYLWDFPVVGKVPYKGFFKKDDAIAEAAKLKKLGFDARVGTVAGWSTLGFFRDPILSSMLERSEGELAELIIHELTHSTIYVKGKAQFNENLATLVGCEGAKLFLVSKYGKSSSQYNDYIGSDFDDKQFARHILRGALRLDSLYKSFSNELADAVKDSLKKTLIERIFLDIDTVKFYDTTITKRYIARRKNFNNVFFAGYKTYHFELNDIEKEFHDKFHSNFKEYLLYLRRTKQ